MHCCHSLPWRLAACMMRVVSCEISRPWRIASLLLWLLKFQLLRSPAHPAHPEIPKNISSLQVAFKGGLEVCQCNQVRHRASTTCQDAVCQCTQVRHRVHIAYQEVCAFFLRNPTPPFLRSENLYCNVHVEALGVL